MSALAPTPRASVGWRRPSIFRLLAAVLAGEFVAGLVLWLATTVLALARLAPLGGAQRWIWLPWRVDGIWAAVGAIGWGYLVSSLVGGFVAERIARRGYGRPAAGWMTIAIALSGYGAMAYGHTAGAHVFAAVLSGAIAIRLLAFELDGSLRPWRLPVSRRWQLLTALAAATVGLSYSTLHSFAADGDGGTFANTPAAAHLGTTKTISIGLQHFPLGVTVTGVDFTGPGAQHLTPSALLMSPNMGAMLIPARERAYPGARHWSGMVWHATRLPYHAAAGRELWVNENLTLSSCGDATVSTLKLRYTILGISTSQTIPLSQPLVITCGRPGARP